MDLVCVGPLGSLDPVADTLYGLMKWMDLDSDEINEWADSFNCAKTRYISSVSP